ncbi:MAG: cytochrome P450 [Acidimicrobiales bacterium]|nr:cytochrome P450 [Acidimicrobiales bacterium]MDG1846117.1 cytochrome P450 [Acidimicrobiales bacterium]
MVDPELNLEEVDFFDPEISECPYSAYKVLRDQAPVWHDNVSGMFVITRYEDIKEILIDTERFRNARNRTKLNPQAETIKELYKSKGWVPAPTLAGRDDPEHKEMKGLFTHAFRPQKIKKLDPFVEKLAVRLVNNFIERGECDWVKEFAIPLPLIVIGHQVGVPEEDIWQIKAWTDAWVQRLGMMQTQEEAIWSTEMEIEAQHYFQPIFERLRENPDDSLLSDLVNTEIPEWGRKLTDEELHAEMMADTFVGGSETSTNAIAAGVMLLIEQPDQWLLLKSDPDKYLPVLVEEILRLEGPVQGLFRETSTDLTLHGVDIPKGSILNIRYASANLDEEIFDRPRSLDLDRSNARQHLAFGFGTHYCMGAPLARREIFFSFKVLIERFDDMWFIEGKNDFRHHPNFCLRALRELHIGFSPR